LPTFTFRQIIVKAIEFQALPGPGTREEKRKGTPGRISREFFIHPAAEKI
jgi:hypothetical protein